MNKDQYITKQLNLNSNIQQAEIERKWRVYEEEQAQIELAMRMSQISSSMVGVSLWEELLYMSIDYMDDELNYVG
jgi:archaellum component FlaF (FlaF/FlaG flagellin family)